MRFIKPIIGLLFATLLIFSSCQEDATNAVYFSKDQLKNDLGVTINDSNGLKISVNSNATLSLTSSDFFQENLSYLKDLEVLKMSYKVKGLTNNPLVSISNVNVFIDEISITEFIDTSLFINVNSSPNSTDNGFEITNEKLLLDIALKLLNKKEVIVSYKSDAVSSDQLDFELEFSITAKGTFIN